MADSNLLHPCGCSVLTHNMRRTPEGTFVEVQGVRELHADTCKFKRYKLGVPIARGVMAPGADGDMPSDMQGTWSTPRSSPNGPIQLKWNLESDVIPWSLGSVLNYPAHFWRNEYRRRVRGEKP